MFCPQCRAEYRAGFRRCSDCDVELVDQLPTEPQQRRSERDDVELVVIRTYPTIIDAELAKTALESVGIDAMVRSDNQGGQSPGLTFTRGAELLVRADDVEAAEDILGVEGIEDNES
jgi:Putative prokaryotic signal transducing protein